MTDGFFSGRCLHDHRLHFVCVTGYFLLQLTVFEDVRDKKKYLTFFSFLICTCSSLFTFGRMMFEENNRLSYKIIYSCSVTNFTGNSGVTTKFYFY